MSALSDLHQEREESDALLPAAADVPPDECAYCSGPFDLSRPRYALNELTFCSWGCRELAKEELE
jgi:hypothetical protein